MIGLNLFWNPYLGPSLSWSDLLVFTLVVVVFVSILSLYYNKVKSNGMESIENDVPIYSSKDILLQERNLGLEVIPVEKTTSIWVKTIVFILIFLVAVTPLYQLLGTDYFL